MSSSPLFTFLVFTFLDGFLFLFHFALILFNLFGGFIPRLRPYHLTTMSLVLLSWVGLGFFYGWGYCFLTDWHFAIRERLGKHDPYENYLQLLFAPLGIALTPEEAKALALGGYLLGWVPYFLSLWKKRKGERKEKKGSRHLPFQGKGNPLVPFFTLLLMGSGCNPKAEGDRTRTPLYSLDAAHPREQGVVQELLRFLPDSRFATQISDPEMRVLLEIREEFCPGCYRIEKENHRLVRISGDLLGIQYGFSSLLETLGYRFFHPFYSFVPDTLDWTRVSEEQGEPLFPLRGLHLHTLHPVEALYDFWLGEDTSRAEQVIDWIIRNRGNYLQVVGLKDIFEPARQRQWFSKMRRILDYAHRRGVKVGFNGLIFARSSLQNGYLIHDGERLYLEPLRELPWDRIVLSFGEFFAETPERFLATLAGVRDEIRRTWEGIPIAAIVHVGGALRVEYAGRDLLYYFLVQFVEGIIPWVHTVMYYNLEDPAGGAYEHEDFFEHRQFLLELLENNKLAGYHPESAYWIAFDNSVPLFLPLYLLSRYQDLRLIVDFVNHHRLSLFPEHVQFSSGWEWGYWLYDLSFLKMSYSPPSSLRAFLLELFSPWGAQGEALAGLLLETANLQREKLILEKLAPYFSSDDLIVNLGWNLGIISQPPRPDFRKLLRYTPAEKERFQKEVLLPWQHFRKELQRLAARGASLPSTPPFFAEVKEGLLLNAVRAQFMEELLLALLHDPSHLSQAKELLEQARGIVRQRHRNLYYPDSESLWSSFPNPTIYPFGYLKQAHTLCFWERELARAKGALGMRVEVPWCIY